MNKWLASPVLLMIAAHAAHAAHAALAQTSVNIYGIADAGLVHESGGVAGSVTKLTSGVGSASRLGFRGTEDLGGGMSAIFKPGRARQWMRQPIACAR
jgi:predicted porin